MKKKEFILYFLILFSSCVKTQQNKIVDVSDYGIKSDTRSNTTAAINKLVDGLEDKEIVIKFPKGVYHFYPDSNYFRTYYETNTYDINPKKLAVLVKHKKNLIIDAQGSDFVFHGHMQPFTVDNCQNITIKNVNIDWQNPLTAESEVVEADSLHILLKIDTMQFPYTVFKDKLVFAAEGWKADWKLSGGSNLIEFDKNHIIPAHTGDFGCVNGDLNNLVYSEISPGLVLIEGKFTKTPSVGHYLIMRHSTRDHAGIFLFHSSNVKLKNINVYHTSGLGILSQYCENIEMHNVNVIPNEHKKRYLSGHDDGLHFMGCRGRIVIDSCQAQGLMDDAINIHGTCVPVKKKLDKHILQCEFAHSMSKGLLWAKKGDTIGFIDKKTMQTVGLGIVEEFIPRGVTKFDVRFEDELPVMVSDKFSLENLSCTPEVHISNSFAGSNRARGYLITTPKKVLIENNVFETSGSAILIAGDANYWYESGAVKNIIIRNNEFKAVCNSSPYQYCKAIISIYPEIPRINPQLPYHSNINIENNTFNMSDYPIVYAKSVDGLSINNNLIRRSYAFEPWHSQKYNFVFEACKDVGISSNTIDNDILGKNIILENMDIDELKNDNMELRVEK